MTITSLYFVLFTALALGVVTSINFLLALQLRINNQGQRGLLWLGIGFNALTLIFFRAAGFFLPELEAVLDSLGLSTQAGGLHILVPLGLSYYTLQTISYLVDVYRG